MSSDARNDPRIVGGLTPISVDLRGPGKVRWCDLSAVGGEEPLFTATVAGAVARVPPPFQVTTDLRILREAAGSPVAPDVVIVHVGRCGSTLLARLMDAHAGVVAISEPQAINDVLAPTLDAADSASVGVLADVVTLLRRTRAANHLFVLKLTSWNLLSYPVLRSLWPSARFCLVVREPVEVLVSIAHRPIGWADVRALGPVIDAAVGEGDDDCGAARTLAALLRMARQVVDDGALVVDYRELPEAAWSRVAPRLGLDVDGATLDRMRARTVTHARRPGRRFEPDSEDKQRAATARDRALSARWTDEAYRALSTR